MISNFPQRLMILTLPMSITNAKTKPLHRMSPVYN